MSTPIIGITGYADQSARPPNVPVFAIARTYVEAVSLAGGTPLIVPPYLEGDPLRAAFDGIDGLILSGGGDIHPSFFADSDRGLLWRVDERRDRGELSLARWALDERRPVLGICRGIQALNVASGGTLIQDIPTQMSSTLSHSSIAGRPLPTVAHTVEMQSGSHLSDLLGAGEVDVNSAHHQAVKELGDPLVVVARAPDGVIEALEAPGHPFCIGVQWHPEVMIESAPIMRRLFEGLIEAARS
ncbi:MAG: gamma-glutamyl-gamma-aminobutyrate hydrolase family protein [Chloroflexota bacterium]|nr:gamma-glutamyl-gamma-aminobutyrate hydrolase family protein [Chloroflexota bacterium]